VVGPTASGKTALAISLAERVGGEIVSADSRQIYRLMDIGTAKPTAEQRARIPHHLLDVVWPDEPYSLALYQRDAQAAIVAIQARQRLPVLAGGTGLYVRSVVDGLTIPAVAPDLAFRATLEAEATHGPQALHARLAALDPVAAANIAPTNIQRIIRALEVCLVTGAPFSTQQRMRPAPYDALLLGLNTDRATLYAWADRRVDDMLATGLVGEVEMLGSRGYGWDLPAMSSLGYREIGAYLGGEMPLDQAVERMKLDTHAYIRRQLTWFRRDERIKWLDPANPDTPAIAWRLIDTWRAAHSAQAH
jgi:tRNA dimethylallyltransferase